MHAHPARLAQRAATGIQAGELVPLRWHLAVDGEIAAEFQTGVATIHLQPLALAAALLPQPGGGQPGRADAGLGRGGDIKRTGQQERCLQLSTATAI